MDFIMSLPLTVHKFDSIWVIVVRFTKSTHFILVHTRFTVEKYAEIYIAYILCLHGVLKMIVSILVCGPLLGAIACFPRIHLIHTSAYYS
jgi:hypothetical protein